MGAVSQYTPELGEKIALLASEGLNHAQIASRLGLTSANALSCLMYKNPDILDKLSRARPAQAELLLNKTQEIAEKTIRGEIPSDAARVFIAHAQWRASRYNPKVYGDKMTLAGDAENPIMLLATRLDDAIKRERQMIDVTPAQPALNDFSDLC